MPSTIGTGPRSEGYGSFVKIGCTMALAIPVSVFQAQKHKLPWLVPGRWRAITHPPIRSRRPLGMDFKLEAG